MKRLALVVLVVLAVGAASYGVTRGLLARGPEDQLAWLQREFRLTDAQVAAVAQMQADYRPVCMEHCRLIQEARTRLAAHPGDDATRAEVARLEGICTAATLAHLRRIAALMAPDQGARFLALVEPRVSRQDHHGPPGLK